jgi:predicted ATPase/class 3 adenylate cyclase
MAAPAGTVTMLFTDVEGSTRLLERLGDDFAGLLATHHRIVRDAVAARRGHEVGCDGDGFFVVFPRAGDALAAAASIQCTLAREAWPGGVSVRVRMGLDTGEPRLVDGDYVGLDVHRAARIAAAAHGGQVVVGETARRLLGDGLPAGLGLRDLGAHLLKDFPAPLRLFQLTGEGLAADFPPLRTLDAPRTNLPAVATSIVGRERELRDARALLARDDVRLVTLTGAGGAGKTRLALAVAGDVAAAFPGGLYAAFLAGVPEPGLVLPAIATAVGARDEPGRPLRESILAALGDDPVLLLLDNLEHLPGAAPVVADLLAGAARLRVLATSRVPLRIGGEHELDVPPLAPAAGAELFAQRARAVRADFRTGEHAVAVEELCRRLDGLPLAIELAAARVRMLPPEALLERLDRRLDLLVGGRDAPERHRTLRATVAWSHDLLGERERGVLRRLAVFVGGFPLDLAGAVAGPDGADVLPELESLVEGNLVRPLPPVAGEPRFLMLETIRSFALERLEEHGEADATRLRHAEAVVGLLERAHEGVRHGHAKPWMDRVDAELGNVRAAVALIRSAGREDLELRLVAATHLYATLRSRWREVAAWLDHVLATPGHENPRLRAMALSSAAMVVAWNGDHARAAGAARESLRLADTLGDPALRAEALNALGIAETDGGDVAGGRRRYEEAAALCRRTGDWALLTLVLANIADSALAVGDAATARERLIEGAGVSREHGLHEITATLQLNLASAELALGALPAARAALADTLRIADRIGYVEGRLYGLATLVAIHAAEGDPERAGRQAGTVEAAFETARTRFTGFEAARHEATLADLRERLGPARLDELRAEGRNVTLDDALAAALASAPETTAPPRTPAAASAPAEPR